MLGLWAVTVKPGGISTTESPWLIQQASSAGTPANSLPCLVMVSGLPPYSASSVRATRPPRSLAINCRP